MTLSERIAHRSGASHTHVLNGRLEPCSLPHGRPITRGVMPVDVPMSPFVRRALAGQLPAKDRTAY